ncbi:MAG: undecaprenyl/decaprenyl-phosphate alpha-N-acetylglucosaminyl 1-phosphate transferase [Pedosphaera sp.]|nr:undecaprenyl/decaprenyl-phosphate alpha-N-acetylglucosaminyl 1-phosphate transferase [Pedosphaera sp.]
MTHYRTYIAVLLISALISAVVSPLACFLAKRLGAIDLPGPRKIHQIPIPRFGGVAIFRGFCFSLGCLYLVDNSVSSYFRNFEKLTLSLVFGAFLMLCLGIYDDCRGANPTQKFLDQILIANLLYLFGFRIDAMTNPFGGEDFQLGLVGVPITIIWIVGVTNSLNLLDEIDGLVAGVTLIISASLAVINTLTGDVLLALLNLCLAGACIGFLPSNKHPAKFFLGDSGSLTIGLILSCIGIISLFETGTTSVADTPIFSVPLILFGLPLFDTTRVIVLRLLRGVPIFQADKEHVHHRLLDLGLSQRQTVWVLYFIASGFGLFSIFLSRLKSGHQVQLSFLFGVVSVGALLVWRFGLKSIVKRG